ncbi:uncharacterized protein LOC102373025 [Alligator sinensis]|uniref:Uncharacterized protein LOC102373025 n=1 Tax=Alligator sinensis TaxID=38654 RepID=A0A1U7RMH7_ALLSI|nr:uncharacterized protein LOC102373025 [Alligator sinensis]XP_025060065.1 uncharacterized protein LOC102373025 [Alligator sinensis]XP_025060070.1 uncharacterized protein LOC102373025 [Alligator sinensis]XP_025060076.1 uncharacterized protein LOC102373025 [Alligator sinensis]
MGASSMGAGQLTGVMLMVCIWLPMVAAQNLIKNPRDQKTEHALLINEINADNPGEDTSEFVELYHTSGRAAPLDGYYLIFYNGNGNLAYRILNLKGYTTDSQGFFLIGSSTVQPRPAVIFPKNTIQNGPDAIALYYGKENFQEGMHVTSDGLVDALVHKSKKTDRADVLLSVLTPDRGAFLEDPSFRILDESIERCRGTDSQWVFQVAMPSPGRDNHCISSSQLNASAALINEVHPMSSPGEFEFIELQGPPSTMLRDLVLVLIEGLTKEVYFFMDVYGKTSPDGLLLIGSVQDKTPVDLPFPKNSSSPLLKTGSNAIALYVGNSSSFALGQAVSTSNLLDALVYTNNERVDPELLEILTPGKFAYENKWYQLGDVSMSRCSCCSVTQDPSVYVLSSPTPSEFNDCPSTRYSQSISLCLHTADCQQWVLRSYEIQMALAQALDKLCNCGTSVAYFKDSSATCQAMGLVFSMLLTAKSTQQLSSLAQAFRSLLQSPEAANFSSWNATVEKACFKDAHVTESPPGASSEKSAVMHEPPSQLPKLLINEVNPDNPGGREDTEYVELFYTGQTHFNLKDYWLVLYNGKNNQAYKVVNLTGYHTNEQGYFLVGSEGVTPKPVIILPPNTIQNGADAIALYYSTTLSYRGSMVVTEEGLVDAVVYTSRASDRADKLLRILAPGQNILYEDDSHSSQDESLSRCNDLTPRLHSSFQVTIITPFRENNCTNSSVLPSSIPPILINELSLTNSTIPYQFIELKGKPGASLGGYSLVFFSGIDGKAYSSIPLKGTFRNTGLFVIAPEGGPTPDLLLPSVKDALSIRQGSSAVAVYNRYQARSPQGMVATLANLVDALVYTWESNTGRGQLDLFGPSHFLPCPKDRSVSLSRCCNMSATLVYAVSDPTPGLENICPLRSLAEDLNICLMTPNCSTWTLNPEQMLDSLEKVLMTSIEENCSCGVSQFYLQELNFTCIGSILKLSGQVWARSLKQQHKISSWRKEFTSSPHPLSVDGSMLRTNVECATPKEPTSEASSVTSLEGWEIALFVLGALLLILVLAGLAFYYIKRYPQNYTNIEMNDRRQIAADF